MSAKVAIEIKRIQVAAVRDGYAILEAIPRTGAMIALAVKSQHIPALNAALQRAYELMISGKGPSSH